jgi:hypothetical protein
MVNQMVRTPGRAIAIFFPPAARWQFSGVRLADFPA